MSGVIILARAYLHDGCMKLIPEETFRFLIEFFRQTVNILVFSESRFLEGFCSSECLERHPVEVRDTHL